MFDLRNYITVTISYWAFTLTDGALRMLVLLYFHTLGYSPIELAFLFLLYEFMGVITNLLGGWLGSLLGLKVTLYLGLFLQVFALWFLSMLNPSWSQIFSVIFVMVAQGLSGIAKDLTKMSSKSAIKFIVPEGEHSVLFKWVAILTGSKNALKGMGFFLGGFFLSQVGFIGTLWGMASALLLVLFAVSYFLSGEIGKAKSKVKFTSIFSKSREINMLSGARFFLFGARDVWFVVGVPIFLYDVLDWSFTWVGGFLAVWVIVYGFIQAWAPKVLKLSKDGFSKETLTSQWLSYLLAFVPLSIAFFIGYGFDPAVIIIGGLTIFGFLFALNSSVHSYLILAFTESDKVALNVGFYYMANAGGRLLGSLLSGISYQIYGLTGCLLTASLMVFIAGLLTIPLSRMKK